MDEILKNISKEFDYLNEQRKTIEEKSVKTIKDRENLNAIEELYKELAIKLNNYVREKNIVNKKERTPSVEQMNIREQFEKNREKIDKIKYQSKALQPKITGSDKVNKQRILEQAGFILTQTVDGNDIMIHPSLVGQYYDAVKEQRQLSQELNKQYYEERLLEQAIVNEEKALRSKQNQQPITNNQSQTLLDDDISQINKKIQQKEEQIRNIQNETGKKMLYKYKGEQYWIPKRLTGRFAILKGELEKLQEKQKALLEEPPLGLNNQTLGVEEEIDFFDEEQTPEEEEQAYQEYLSEKKGRTIDRNNQVLNETAVPIDENITQTVSETNTYGTQIVNEILNDSENIVDNPFEQENESTNIHITNQDNHTTKEPNQSFIDKLKSIGEKSNLHSQNFSTENFENRKNKLGDLLTELEDKVPKEPANSPENLEDMSFLSNDSLNTFTEEPPRYSASEVIDPITGESIPLDDPIQAEVVNSRKSKRNIKRKLIIAIATIASSLVLMATGVHHHITKNHQKVAMGTATEKISENPDDLVEEIDTDSLLTEITEKQTEGKNHTNEKSISQPGSTSPKTLSEHQQSTPPVQKPSIQDQINNQQEQDYTDESMNTLEEKAISSQNQSPIKIGGTIKLQETAGIYRDELSAYLDDNGQNALHPYWSNDDEKIYLGGLYETAEGEFRYIYANDENANYKQDEIIQNGGKLLSALIAQPSEYYKVYDGQTPLTLSEINKCAAGWIQVGDIKTNNSELSGGRGI